MVNDLEALIVQYREKLKVETTPTLELAKMEQSIWGIAKLRLRKEGKSNLRASFWFRGNISQKLCGNVEIHLALLQLGNRTGDYRLFGEIDAKRISLYQARNAMHRAKELVRIRGIGLPAALTEVLENNQEPTPKFDPPEPLPQELGDHAIPIETTRQFYQRISALTHEFIHSKLQGVEEADRIALANEFTTDLRVLYEELLRRMQLYRRDVRVAAKIPLGDVVRACECLGVRAPTYKVPPDMKLARAAYRRLSAQLHPDKRASNSDISIVQQYTAVQEAWQLLLGYERQLRK